MYEEWYMITSQNNFVFVNNMASEIELIIILVLYHWAGRLILTLYDDTSRPSASHLNVDSGIWSLYFFTITCYHSTTMWHLYEASTMLNETMGVHLWDANINKNKKHSSLLVKN